MNGSSKSRDVLEFHWCAKIVAIFRTVSIELRGSNGLEPAAVIHDFRGVGRVKTETTSPPPMPIKNIHIEE